MSFFIGESEASMDDKNRLTIPKKFRAVLPFDPQGKCNVWVIQGYRECDFVIMDDPGGHKFFEAFRKAPLGAGKDALVKRLLGRTERIEVDGSGRVLLPQRFLERCEVEGREFTMTGNGNMVEVYSRTKWERLQSELTKDAIDGLWDEYNSLGQEAGTENTEGALATLA